MTSNRRGILLVEGRDDREVVYQFCNRHGVDNRSLFDVHAKEGIESLLADLRIRPRTDIEALGVIVDADADPTARWDQIRGTLEPLGYSLPAIPLASGTCIPAPSPTRPRVGVWMMPDNRIAGVLEDFLLSLVHEHDSLIGRANDVVDAIADEDRRFSAGLRSKAVVHTWLAWQEQPGTSLGHAITRRYLDPSRASAPLLRAWLLDVSSPLSGRARRAGRRAGPRTAGSA